MNKIKKWQHNKEFDTKTLLTDISDNSPGDSTGKKDSVSETKKAVDLRNLSDISDTPGPAKKTQVYEPRPITPDDDLYEDILEQFASAPTKPKYWFEEFGDYWSCSCGHINKGGRCKNCGLERELLRSLFILHKPAGEPGKLSKKLKKSKEQADKEDALQTVKDQKLKTSAPADINNIQPIEKSPQDTDTAADSGNITEAVDPTAGDRDNTASATAAAISAGGTGPSAEPSDHPEVTSDKDGTTAASSALPAVLATDAPSPARNIRKLITVISAIIFAIAILSVGGYFTYKYLAAPAMAYDEARDLQSSGKYEEAIKKFEELGDYKDSSDLIWECYCSIGDEYFDNGKYNSAIETYNTALEMKDSDTVHDKIWKCYCKIGDRYLAKKKYTKAISTYNQALELKDSNNVRDKINKAKFGYVRSNLSNGGDKFETYLSDLMKINYSGVRDIYDEYYAWHVNIIANNSENDFERDMDSISRHETAYFHAMLSGGEPDETINLYYEVTWPNGSSQVYDMDNTWKSGAKITARFQYPMPLFGKEGTLTFKLYDKSTQELLGTDKIRFRK